MAFERQSQPLAMTASETVTKSSTVPSSIDRTLVEKLVRIAGNPPIDIQLWDGSKCVYEDGPARNTMEFKNRSAFYDVLKSREIGFGDRYSDGSIEVHGDLVEFLCDLYVSQRKAKQKQSIQLKLLSNLTKKKARDNTLAGSKSNIHHHYDLGNEFYTLWLDREAMQYTCAYFARPDYTIEQAQAAKMEHVCRKLMLKPGQTVVEAGCGWGGLARYMARNYGVKVKSYNISHEQIVYAQERAQIEGLSDQVEYIEDDYRNISGEFDVFVSVGMLEHVGKQNYQVLGSVIDRCLSKDGLALVHSIGRNVPELMSAWIEKRIFPGAYPPTIREMMDIVEPCNFSVLDIENLRLHYAETLRHWLARYNENEDKVRSMFDEQFVRAWRLYLSGSIAAFLVGSLQLFQMVFTRGSNNDVPSTREHLYPMSDQI